MVLEQPPQSPYAQRRKQQHAARLAAVGTSVTAGSLKKVVFAGQPVYHKQGLWHRAMCQAARLGRQHAEYAAAGQVRLSARPGAAPELNSWELSSSKRWLCMSLMLPVGVERGLLQKLPLPSSENADGTAQLSRIHVQRH